MIEQLRTAGDQLRAAWDNYYHICSNIRNSYTKGNPSHTYGFPPELIHQLDIELDFISAYEKRIQQIKVAIGRARNYSSNMALINTLPPEVMTRIFHLVPTKSCELELLPYSIKRHYPRYPDYLAQVCSLWRTIAVSCRSLWCHIDLSPYEPCCAKLLARAETHVKRADGQQFHLHISDHAGDYHEWEDASYQNIFGFVSRVSSRVATLQLSGTQDLHGFHHHILSSIFLSPDSILTKLIICSDGDRSNSFIVAQVFDPTEPDEEWGNLVLNCTTTQLEAALAPLIVLRLRGIFPLWSSAAYHGLVDLRLRSTEQYSQIQEVELVTILKSSPGLRIFYFELEICGLTPENVQVTAVHLPDLQVVAIFPHNHDGRVLCPGSVLRLLKPGTKPLRLSFEDHFVSDDVLMTELEIFFRRSKVARFYTRFVSPPLSVLIRHAADLEQIIVDDLESYRESEEKLPSTWLQLDKLALLPRLRSLRVTRSNLFVNDVHFLLKFCPTGTVLHSCFIYRDLDGDSSLDSGPVSPNELRKIFPSAKIVDDPQFLVEEPVADWDILD